jgi:hypothetical protein
MEVKLASLGNDLRHSGNVENSFIIRHLAR